jgi:hypothetical protein
MKLHAVNNLEEGLIWMKSKIDEFLPKELDDNLNESVKFFMERYWKDLAPLPASSTGRYHHSTENVKPFGLINHTLRVVWFTKEIGIEETGYPAGYDKWKGIKKIREAIAAAFLHDFGKVESFKADHGKESARMVSSTSIYGISPSKEQLEEFNDIALSPEVCNMIRRHMHNWSFIHCVEMWDRIVAYADYLASRPTVHLSDVTYLVMEGQQNVFRPTGTTSNNQ